MLLWIDAWRKFKGIDGDPRQYGMKSGFIPPENIVHLSLKLKKNVRYTEAGSGEGTTGNKGSRTL